MPHTPPHIATTTDTAPYVRLKLHHVTFAVSFEEAPGPQIGSGYSESLGYVLDAESDVCS